MSISEPKPTGMSAAFLSEKWRAASHASVWRTPGDWHGPAVESMVHAVVDGVDAESAAARLGAERGQRGIGLVEGLDDLSALFGVVSDEEPPYALARSFAREWAEVTASGLLGRASTDDLTGLSTLDYLLVRVRELYAEAAADETTVDESYCLIVVDAGDAALSGWQRVLRKSLVARILRDVFYRGQTTSVLPSGNFVVIAKRDTSLDEWLVRLRLQLTRASLAEPPEGSPVTARIEALAASEFATIELLDSL